MISISETFPLQLIKTKNDQSVSSTPMKTARYLFCKLNPITFIASDMFPQTHIKGQNKLNYKLLYYIVFHSLLKLSGRFLAASGYAARIPE
jgi:hypothetical protein